MAALASKSLYRNLYPGHLRSVAKPEIALVDFSANCFQVSMTVTVTVTVMGHEKSACPGRVLWRTLHGVLVGLVGGASVVAVTDLKDGKPTNEVCQNVVSEAPAFAIANGIIMAFYTTVECTFEHMRETEDAVNSFIAGGIVGAVLGAPQGPKQMAIFGILGSLTFGILDGLL